MKVVHLAGWYLPESLGGTELYVDALSRWLVRAGHEVMVAVPDASGAPERTCEHDGIPVYRFPVPTQVTRDEAQGNLPVRGADRLHRWLRAVQPDIAHFHGFVTGLGIHEVEAAQSIGARTVLTNHLPSLGFLCRRGTWMRWGARPCEGVAEPSTCAACVLQERGLSRAAASLAAGVPASLGTLFGALPGKAGTALGLTASIRADLARQRDLLNWLDAFVVLNQQAVEIVRANGLSLTKVLVNRLGVSLSGLTRKPGPETSPTRLPITVGFIGRIDAIKGIAVLIQAIRRLDEIVPIRLVVYGPVAGAHEASYFHRLKGLAAGDSRITIGRALKPEEVGATLARFDVLCCPSVSFENGPTVALEAQAVGTPVIGSRIGALPEIVDHGVNGRLFDAGDAVTLASLLADLARDPSGTIDRWRRNLPAVRTMDDVARDYLSLYERLCQPRKAAAWPHASAS
jgi:glycosyltransferase involved in cell wall biosynthesis